MSVNLAVVRGTCSSPAQTRVLPSGVALVSLQLTTRTEEGAVSVPVVVADPPVFVETLDAGDEVVVLGRCRRRFFRTGAGTGSRVEVEASSVVPARDRRRVGALVRRAVAALEGLSE
jgi:hypothetical protein